MSTINNTTSVEIIQQTYDNFTKYGGILEPGHIVYVQSLSDEYAINKEYKASDRDIKPYMIWKVQGERLFAFPIASQSAGFKFEFTGNIYPVTTPEDSLELNTICLNMADVSVVEAKVPEELLQSIMEIQYKKIYIDNRGISTVSTRTFINTVNKKRRACTGCVIVNYDFDAECNRYYYVYDVDTKHQKYKTIEVDSNFQLPPDGKIIESYLDMRQPRLEIINYVGNSNYLNSCVPFKSLLQRDFKGFTFYQDGRKLMIVKEENNTEQRIGYYVCVDVTESLNPQAIDLVFVSNTISLLQVNKESPRISGNIISRARSYMLEHYQEVETSRAILVRKLKPSITSGE